MQLDGMNIVVVGGGSGGAAAALLLARAGARLTLLERVAEPRAVGAGIGIAQNGAAVLESLGLGPGLARLGREVGAPRIVDGRGRTLLEPPEASARVTILRRSDLMQLMIDAVIAEPRIEARFGAEVVGASVDGVLTVRDASGERELPADLVIGADGVHSAVRGSADFGARLRGPGIAYLRVLVDGELAREEEAWTSAGIFGSFATVDGGTYAFASAGSPPCRRSVEAGDLDGLRAVWARAYPPSEPILARVARFDDLILNRVLRVECARWWNGRLALVGDAAHAMAPNLGQGANSALVDAAVLLDELRRHPTLDDALTAYQRRRAPAVRWVARTAARLGSIAERTDAVTRWLRDRVVLPLAARAAGDVDARVLQESPETLRAIGR
jgi:2-polyprenyl-6-methoxyphenol hydroxylase-like FAD-dependent oxidoreductase